MEFRVLELLTDKLVLCPILAGHKLLNNSDILKFEILQEQQQIDGMQTTQTCHELLS